MKTIGLIGGTSWETTMQYYRIINQTIREQLDNSHCAKCLLYSVDCYELERYQNAGDWLSCADILMNAASTLENGGADFIVLCDVTLHKIALQIQDCLSIPLLHIVDAAADELLKKGVTKVGLLGSKISAQHSFYKRKLIENGIDVCLPDTEDIALMAATVQKSSSGTDDAAYSSPELLRIVRSLIEKGAEGILVNDPSFNALLEQPDADVLLFDPLKIHATKAAFYSLCIGM